VNLVCERNALDVTLKTTKQNLIAHINKSEICDTSEGLASIPQKQK